MQARAKWIVFVVLMMIASSLMAETRKSPGLGPAVKTLNVVLEGPMVFFMENTQMRVLVPKAEGHHYMVDMQEAGPGTYALQGARGAETPEQVEYQLPAGSEAFVLSAAQLHLTLDTDKQPYQTFLLPLPKRIVALTKRDAEIVDATGHRRNAVGPTSYVFVYEVADAAQLSLSHSGWEPARHVVDQQYTNLVIAAGLPRGQAAGEHHAHQVFAEITGLVKGLEKMRFIESGPETTIATVKGLPRELRQGLPAESAQLSSAVYHPEQQPRLIQASSIYDCTVPGGVIVKKF